MSNAGVSAQPALEKQQFENQTGGWVGVVILDAQGNPQGVSVEPNGKVWLSEAEKRLTAEAPRSDAHNPFAEQPFNFIDTDTGQRVVQHIAPLKPVSDARFVPASNRYIPPSEAQGATDASAAQATATADEPQTAVRTDVETPRATAEREIVEEGKSPIPAPPRRAAKAAKAARQKEEAAVEEETAEEEVGAAVPPTGEAAEGEFGAHEEVGTPTLAEQTPPPYTPASDDR